MAEQTKQQEVASQLEDAWLALTYVERLIDEDDHSGELPKLRPEWRIELGIAALQTLNTAARLGAPWAARELTKRAFKP